VYTEGPDPELQLFKPLSFNVPDSVENEELQLQQGVNRWKWNNLLFRAALKDYAVNKDKTYPLRLESQRKLLETSVEQLRADKLLEQVWSINQEYLKEALEKIENCFRRCILREKSYFFKIYSEHLIIILFALSVLMFIREYNKTKNKMVLLLCVSLEITIFSETAFVLYFSVYDIYNYLGHVYKFIAFFIIFRAILLTIYKSRIESFQRQKKN